MVYGHVAYVVDVGDDYIDITEGGSRWPGASEEGICNRRIYTWSTYQGKSTWPDQGFIHLTTPTPTVPALPDGDYIITTAADSHYYLDIVGGDYPAAGETNVQLYYSPDGNVSDIDAWTLHYNGNGYYRISQYHQNVSLDVYNESTANEANVQVWYNNDSSAQQWRITGSSSSGYRIQAQCSGKYLEYADSILAAETNVQQWAYGDVAAQKWMFIPYKPTVNLDVNGWTDNAENGWVSGFGTFDVWINGSRVANDVNDFCQQVTLGAPYEIKDIKVADGKSFDGFSSYTRGGFVSGGRTGTINANTDVRLQFHTMDAAAFKRNHSPSNTAVYNGHSYYFYNVPTTWYEANLVSEYLGGHLVAITSASEESFVKGIIGNSDLWIGASDKNTEGNWRWTTGESMSYSDWGENQPDNAASPGEGTENYVHIWGNTGKWNDNAGCVQYPFMCEIDRAYTVRYYANGGSVAPSAQEKAVGQTIKLSAVRPTREGYEFLGWGTSSAATAAQYQPGENYSTDANLNLYAVWERIGNTIIYDGNGGEPARAEQFKPAGETIMLSPDIPTRTGYTFLGWATSATATTARYQPGDRYSTDADLTLYALWRITNPPTLTGKNITMLVGDTRELADFVELTHDGVLSYTLTATAGGVVALDGQRVTATAPGSGALIVSVAEYPAAICTVSINVVDLSAMLRLPAALTEIENEAFENCGAAAVTLPSGCESIGSRAFADNPDLVYIFIPASVTQIAQNAFVNSPNVTIYCYSGSVAAMYAAEHSLRFVLVSDGWVLADALPLGATVTDEKWTYQKATTETTTSTAGNLEGWTQTGFDWQQTGSGTHVYANYPDGFDTGHPLYSAYAKGALTGSTSGNTKREVSASTVKDYIYWHWTWYWGTSENKLISDQYCIEDGREYNNFKAYENSYIEYVSGQNYVNWDRGGEEDGSCWWFRFDVCQQSYTDYQKLFTYTRTVTTDETSTTPVAPGSTISNVLHWVKYEL